MACSTEPLSLMQAEEVTVCFCLSQENQGNIRQICLASYQQWLCNKQHTSSNTREKAEKHTMKLHNLYAYMKYNERERRERKYRNIIYTA